MDSKDISQNDRQKFVRNFCIVAHIDHGKSTLADRLMEFTGLIEKRNLTTQMLDSMDIERERGITIKLTPTTMKYKFRGQEYTLNLIDTPGHVDFTYEVSRSLAACEGAILIVDATQGVEAQTLANVYLALEHDLEILPVINKIDLPSADIEEARKEIEDIIGLPADKAPAVSAKEGTNIEQVLEQVILQIPSPKGDVNKPLKALIFDSYYDNFKGAVCMVRVVDGSVKMGDTIKFFTNKSQYTVTEVGIFSPKSEVRKELVAGDVGYICASIKNVSETKVGDTITKVDKPAAEPLPGYKEVKPVVFSGVFCVDGSRYNDLKDALEKLKLNDASLEYQPEVSQALGFGFRCGFLGLLHMEIIQERLEREFNLELITTAPTVGYIIHKSDGVVITVSNPAELPSPQNIEYMEEPIVRATIFTPPAYVGALMELAQTKRGVHKDLQYLDPNRCQLIYEIPLNEVIYDFFDQLKSRSHGYASLDYEIIGMQRSDLVKLDILLNGENCDALSLIVHREKAYQKGKGIVERLKDVIPRQLFEVPLQAAIGNKVIARETVRAMRKDVLAKCYGGDISRKRKLLEKQKKGKKRMRQIGSVEIPSEAFMSILKID